MKYALVDPDGNVSMVVNANKRFKVAPPLEWVACPAEAVPDKWVRVGNEILPAVPDMQALKKMKAIRIRIAMESAIDDPVVVGGNTFRAGAVHRARIDRLVKRSNKGKSLPAKISDKSGTKVSVTPQLLANIQDAMDDQLDAAHARYADLEELIDQATTEAELDAVVW